MRRMKIGVLLACLLAMSAVGLSEVQWLRYRTGANVGSELSVSIPRPYRRFESSPPTGVRMPQFKSDDPLFIKWTTPMDAQGYRWIALDRSSSHGRHDLLYIDTDGDGHLDDETPHQGSARDQYRVAFDPIPVYLLTEDGPVTYHLACEFYSRDQRSTWLVISTGSYYEGTVQIDGQAVPCVLIDYNGNGTFDDTAEDFNADRILLGEGRDRREYFVGRYLEYEGTLYRLEIARDGAYVKMTAAPDVAYGTVSVPENLTLFSAGGVNGLFEKTPENGQVRLPEGSYRVHRWEIARTEKGQHWTLSGRHFPRQQSFQVRSASPITVDVGEPVFSRLSVTQRHGAYQINQELRGKQDERIDLRRGSSRPAAPQVRIRSQTGDYDRTFTLEYG